MSLKLICPNCGRALTVPAQLEGKIGTCPNCQTRIRIPTLPAHNSTAQAPPFAASVSASPDPADALNRSPDLLQTNRKQRRVFALALAAAVAGTLAIMIGVSLWFWNTEKQWPSVQATNTSGEKEQTVVTHATAETVHGSEKDKKIISEDQTGVIGAGIEALDGHKVVVQLTWDSPAQQKGIRLGDRLLMVGNSLESMVPVDDKSDKEVADLIRGPIGSETFLAYSRAGRVDRIDCSIVRREKYDFSNFVSVVSDQTTHNPLGYRISMPRSNVETFPGSPRKYELIENETKFTTNRESNSSKRLAVIVELLSPEVGSGNIAIRMFHNMNSIKARLFRATAGDAIYETVVNNDIENRKHVILHVICQAPYGSPVIEEIMFMDRDARDAYKPLISIVSLDTEIADSKPSKPVVEAPPGQSTGTEQDRPGTAVTSRGVLRNKEGQPADQLPVKKKPSQTLPAPNSKEVVRLVARLGEHVDKLGLDSSFAIAAAQSAIVFVGDAGPSPNVDGAYDHDELLLRDARLRLSAAASPAANAIGAIMQAVDLGQVKAGSPAALMADAIKAGKSTFKAKGQTYDIGNLQHGEAATIMTQSGLDLHAAGAALGDRVSNQEFIAKYGAQNIVRESGQRVEVARQIAISFRVAADHPLAAHARTGKADMAASQRIGNAAAVALLSMESANFNDPRVRTVMMADVIKAAAKTEGVTLTDAEATQAAKEGYNAADTRMRARGYGENVGVAWQLHHWTIKKASLPEAAE